MNNDRIAHIIETQFDEWLLYPELKCKTRQFKTRSYRRWAIKQLCWELRRNPLTPPLLIVDNFIKTITGYKGTNKELRFIYKVALRVAENVLDLVNALS